MRYFATWRHGAIMTDDYSKNEIAKGLHIKHIKKDIEECQIKGIVKVYDEHMRFVCLLNNKKSIA